MLSVAVASRRDLERGASLRGAMISLEVSAFAPSDLVRHDYANGAIDGEGFARS